MELFVNHQQFFLNCFFANILSFITSNVLCIHDFVLQVLNTSYVPSGCHG